MFKRRKKTDKIPDYDELFNNCSSEDTKKPLKMLWLLFKHDKYKLLFAVLVYSLKHTPLLALPIVTSNLIDIATEGGSSDAIFYNVLVFMVILVLNIPLHYLFIYLFNGSLRKMEAGIRGTLSRKMHMLSIQYYKEMMSGKLQSKVLRDVEQVQMLANSFFNILLPTTLNLIFSLVVTLYKNWSVAVMYMCLAPLTLIMMFALRNSIQKRNNEFRSELESMSALVTEMIGMIPVTRAHALEAVEIEKIDNKFSSVADKGFSLDKINGWFASSSWVIFVSSQVICLVFTIFLARRGYITVADVVLFQTFFTQIVGQLNNLVAYFPQFAVGFESMNSITEVLMAEDLEKKDGMVQLDNLNGNYVFKDLFYKYPDANEDEYILKDFNLEVKAGESVAFVGESGSGKSTLINLIIGYDNPVSGLLLIDRINVKNIDLVAYRKNIAVVPQNNILFSGTIKDNITYGLKDVSDERIFEVLEMANCTEFINKLPNGIYTKVGEHGGKLSGGQRQRIAIARALIRDPKVIIFDEATSALDSISEAKVQVAINSMMKNRTVFMVAHRLSTIKEADKIVVFRGGKCVECGMFDELMEKKGEFYQYRQLQN